MKASTAITAAAAMSGAGAARIVRREAVATTVAADYSPGGWSPRPTPPPGGFHFLPVNHDKRADSASGDTTALIAPDNTCGYVSGRAGAAYTCGIDFTCALITASASFPGYVACFNEVNFGARIDCVNYEQFYSSSACTDGCEVDAFTLKCTQSSFPFCNTVSFSSSIYDFWCNSVEDTSIRVATTTYSGQEGRTFSDMVLSDTDATSSVSNAAPSATGIDYGSSTTDSSSSSTSTGGSSGSHSGGGSKTPIGPIVGGVVGGVAALALIGLLAWLLIRSKKKQKAVNAAATPGPGGAPPPMYQPAQQGAYVSPHQSYYDPKFSNMPPSNMAPSGAPGGFYPMATAAPTTASSPPPQGAGPNSSPTVSYTGTASNPNSAYPSGFGQASPSPPAPSPPQGQQAGFFHEAPSKPDETTRGGVHELG